MAISEELPRSSASAQEVADAVGCSQTTMLNRRCALGITVRKQDSRGPDRRQRKQVQRDPDRQRSLSLARPLRARDRFGDVRMGRWFCAGAIAPR